MNDNDLRRIFAQAPPPPAAAAAKMRIKSEAMAAFRLAQAEQKTNRRRKTLNSAKD